MFSPPRPSFEAEPRRAISEKNRVWMSFPNGALQSAKRCGSQSEGPGFKSRRRRWDSSVGQTANGPCLSCLSCINEYKVFLRCPPVYGGTTSATISWCNGASPEMLRKKHLFPKGLLKKKN